MTTGYKLMLLFFILAYAAGVVFLPGVSAWKYAGALPLVIALYWALTDPEKFMPESGRVMIVVFLGLIADLLPLTLYVAAANVIK